MSWMEEMDVFLHVEDPTKGDLPAHYLEKSSLILSLNNLCNVTGSETWFDELDGRDGCVSTCRRSYQG